MTQRYVQDSPVTASMHIEMSKLVCWKLIYSKQCFFGFGKEWGKGEEQLEQKVP